MSRKLIVIFMAIFVLTLTACGTNQTGSDESIASGEQLYKENGCGGCHAVDTIAPPLQGLYGSQVTLSDGEIVTADEDYLTESIADPEAKIVQGYQSLMPDFSNQISDEEVQALVEYIKSLSK
jgi:cytochrome c oxidase subunit 2